MDDISQEKVDEVQNDFYRSLQAAQKGSTGAADQWVTHGIEAPVNTSVPMDRAAVERAVEAMFADKKAIAEASSTEFVDSILNRQLSPLRQDVLEAVLAGYKPAYVREQIGKVATGGGLNGSREQFREIVGNAALWSGLVGHAGFTGNCNAAADRYKRKSIRFRYAFEIDKCRRGCPSYLAGHCGLFAAKLIKNAGDVPLSVRQEQIESRKNAGYITEKVARQCQKLETQSPFRGVLVARGIVSIAADKMESENDPLMGIKTADDEIMAAVASGVALGQGIDAGAIGQVLVRRFGAERAKQILIRAFQHQRQVFADKLPACDRTSYGFSGDTTLIRGARCQGCKHDKGLTCRRHKLALSHIHESTSLGLGREADEIVSFFGPPEGFGQREFSDFDMHGVVAGPIKMPPPMEIEAGGGMDLTTLME